VELSSQAIAWDAFHIQPSKPSIFIFQDETVASPAFKSKITAAAHSFWPPCFYFANAMFIMKWACATQYFLHLNQQLQTQTWTQKMCSTMPQIG
jgi:hypothetical protein